jgi:protein O-mannosyl-transferase
MLNLINTHIDTIITKNRFVVYFFLVVGIFVYGNALFGPFLFDDNTFIENNTHIKSLYEAGSIYTNSTTAGAGIARDNFYRPNQQFIYAILYSIVGLSPFLFHFVCVLFHILNAFLVFLLFTKLGLSRKVSLFGATVFILHPVLSQAVSYVSGLSEPLVFSTILISILITYFHRSA